MRIVLTHSRPRIALAACLAGSTLLAACGSDDNSSDADKNTETSAAESGAESGDGEGSEGEKSSGSDESGEGSESGSGEEVGDSDDAAEAQPVETAGPEPRIAYTFDGGVQVLDAKSLEPVGEPLEAEGFTRLSDIGDGRHLALSESSHWQMLDLGVFSQPHGDHSHSYAKDPVRTEISIEGDHPGHVTHHDGRVLTWADGTGQVKEFEASSLISGVTPKTKDWKADAPHHGVAVPTEDGGMLVTDGTEESVDGIRALDAKGKEIASTDECPGVHGEAEVKGAITFGCEDGMVIWKDGKFTKVDGPGEYSRMGNQRGSEVSPIAFADLKTDPDADPVERTEQVALVDTRTAEMKTVDLGTSYWFRSLGRMSDGDGLILGYDGALHRIDVENGKVTDKLPVIGTWKEKADWQQPGPALHVMGETAFVTEPKTKEVHRIDLEEWKVTDSAKLEHEPNELNGVDAEVPELAAQEEGEHGGHGHAGHDHGEGEGPSH
ncbi:hypothetical protein [Kytococcus sp. Marseille-QA3725]